MARRPWKTYDPVKVFPRRQSASTRVLSVCAGSDIFLNSPTSLFKLESKECLQHVHDTKSNTVVKKKKEKSKEIYDWHVKAITVNVERWRTLNGAWRTNSSSVLRSWTHSKIIIKNKRRREVKAYTLTTPSFLTSKHYLKLKKKNLL